MIDLQDGRWIIYGPKAEELGSLIGNASRRSSIKATTVPANGYSLGFLKGFVFTPKALIAIKAYEEKEKRLNEVIGNIKKIGEPFDSKTIPFDHQRKMFWASCSILKEKNTGFFYHCGVGTGKTLPCIFTALHLGFRTLVVTPSGLKYNFAQQIEQHSDAKFSVLDTFAGSKWTDSSISIHDYINGYRKFVKEPSGFFNIISYESMTKAPEMFMDYGLVIFDECHALKNRTSKRSKAAKQLGISRRLGVSGTILAKNPLDIWSQFNIMDPDIFPIRYTDFESRVAIIHNVGFNLVVGWKPDGLKWIGDNVAKRSIMYRIDECIDLPEKNYQSIELSTPPKITKAYKKLKDEFVVELEGAEVSSLNVLGVMSKLRQLSSGIIRDDEGEYHLLDKFKINTIVDLINSTDDQIIIWYWHNFFKDQLVKAIKEKVIVINSESDALKKNKLLSEFQDGKVRIAIWQLNVSEGYTATAANIAIYAEHPFDIKTRTQSEGRIYRPGQCKKTFYIDLIAENTLDKKIIKAFKMGESLTREIFLKDML